MIRQALVLVLAASGCTRNVTRREELAMSCEMVTDNALTNVWRCVNAEATCYVYRESVHCERIVRPALELETTKAPEPAAPASDWRKGMWRRIGAILELKPEGAPPIKLRVKEWER